MPPLSLSTAAVSPIGSNAHSSCWILSAVPAHLDLKEIRYFLYTGVQSGESVADEASGLPNLDEQRVHGEGWLGNVVGIDERLLVQGKFGQINMV